MLKGSLVKTNNKEFKLLSRHQSGIALLEALVAVLIFGMVAALFVGGLSVASKADFIIGERSLAESLAWSQMENVKAQNYIDYSVPNHGNYDLIAAPATYVVEANTIPIEPSTGQPLVSGKDKGVQRIIVSIKHHDAQVVVLEGYKVNR